MYIVYYRKISNLFVRVLETARKVSCWQRVLVNIIFTDNFHILYILSSKVKRPQLLLKYTTDYRHMPSSHHCQDSPYLVHFYKYRKVTCLDRWNVRENKTKNLSYPEGLLEYFSIHIWSTLLREQTLS